MITGQQTYPQYFQGYPTYPQIQQPVQVAQQSIQSMPSQVLEWVQSEDEAIKFPLMAGQSIFLMNQNDDYLYMKSVDQLGKTKFIKKRLIDESDNQEPKVDLSGYIKKDEITAIIMDIVQKEVEKRVSEISFKPTKTKRRIVSED